MGSDGVVISSCTFGRGGFHSLSRYPSGTSLSSIGIFFDAALGAELDSSESFTGVVSCADVVFASVACDESSDASVAADGCLNVNIVGLLVDSAKA